MNTINKDEILKSSKWIRFLYMILYVLLVNFIVLPVAIALSFIQFLFVLFISQPNKSIANVNKHIIEFFNDSISFLLFQTEEKPFHLKAMRKKRHLMRKRLLLMERRKKYRMNHQSSLEIN